MMERISGKAKRSPRWAWTLWLALLASACGGGDDTSNSATASPPPMPTPTTTPTPTAALTATPTPTPAPTGADITTPPWAPSSDLLRVVYIGGSITQGAFATSPAKSYAGLLTAWLETHYTRVEARNLGVGATGSEFAAYRLDHDLAGFAPDLAFIEFAVNDAGTSRAGIFAQTDAIIYRLRQANPYVRIVYVSTADIAEEAKRRAGGRARYTEDSAAVAAFEEIGFVDVGQGLWREVIAGTPVSTYISDSVHPTDAGHRLYFEQIRQALEALVPLTPQPAIRGSKLIEQSRLDTARLEPARDASGCAAAALPLTYIDAAIECGEGDAFSYRFSGTTVGIVRAMVRDGGRLACTIDGGRPTTVDFFDEGTPAYERPSAMILYRELEKGPHVLACRATGEVISLTTGTSSGHRAAIGYFLVSDARPVTLP